LVIAQVVTHRVGHLFVHLAVALLELMVFLFAGLGLGALQLVGKGIARCLAAFVDFAYVVDEAVVKLLGCGDEVAVALRFLVALPVDDEILAGL
jgi:hypothetical protein